MKNLLICLFALCTLQILAQEKPIKEFENGGHNIICLAFSPDCKLVATGGMDNNINLWDVNTGTLLNSFKGHTDWIVSIAISPDGNYILSGCKDKTARIWDIKSGSEVTLLKGHEATVAAVTYSYDGKTIATGCKEPESVWWRGKLFSPAVRDPTGFQRWRSLASR